MNSITTGTRVKLADGRTGTVCRLRDNSRGNWADIDIDDDASWAPAVARLVKNLTPLTLAERTGLTPLADADAVDEWTRPETLTEAHTIIRPRDWERSGEAGAHAATHWANLMGGHVTWRHDAEDGSWYSTCGRYDIVPSGKGAGVLRVNVASPEWLAIGTVEIETDTEAVDDEKMRIAQVAAAIEHLGGAAEGETYTEMARGFLRNFPAVRDAVTGYLAGTVAEADFDSAVLDALAAY